MSALIARYWENRAQAMLWRARPLVNWRGDGLNVIASKHRCWEKIACSYVVMRWRGIYIGETRTKQQNNGSRGDEPYTPDVGRVHVCPFSKRTFRTMQRV